MSQHSGVGPQYPYHDFRVLIVPATALNVYMANKKIKIKKLLYSTSSNRNKYLIKQILKQLKNLCAFLNKPVNCQIAACIGLNVCKICKQLYCYCSSLLFFMRCVCMYFKLSRFCVSRSFVVNCKGIIFKVSLNKSCKILLIYITIGSLVKNDFIETFY